MRGTRQSAPPRTAAHVIDVHDHDHLARDLRSLPLLYEELAQWLVVSRGSGARRARSSSAGIPLDARTVGVRDDIRTVLASWAGLLAEHLGTSPPERAVPALAAFLLEHREQLREHGAGLDAVTELRGLVTAATEVLSGTTTTRVPVGPCVRPWCRGTLTAVIRQRAVRTESVIACTDDSEHTWSPESWHTLGDAQPAAGLSAADVATGWDLPTGTVYWLAKTHKWRRYRDGRKVFYHRSDVVATMEEKRATKDAGEEQQ